MINCTSSEDKSSILDTFIRERWSNKFSIKNYQYIASYYLEEISLNGKKILDIGCGNGLLLSTNCVFSNPKLAVGLDTYRGEGSPVQDYELVKKMHKELSLDNLRLVIGDALQFPFNHAVFDVIYISHCLHHIYESRIPLQCADEKSSMKIISLLKDVYNMLSRSGIVIIVEVPKYTALRFARPFGFFKNAGFTTKQEPSDWMYALEKAGFSRFKIKFHTPYPLRHFRRLFSSKIGRYLICGQYYILAYKR